MNIDFTSRPWNEFITLYEEGKLAEENEFYDTPEGEEFEKKCFSFYEMTECDSHRFYTQVFYENESILEKDFNGKDAFGKFNKALFNDDDEFAMDIKNFDEVNECVVGLFSSDRVKDISKITELFSIKDIEAIHIETGEEEGYIDYLKSMIKLINKAAKNNHGLEVFMG